MRHLIPFSLLLLASCTMGPDYKGPGNVAPAPERFVRGDANQAAHSGEAHWWQGLGDPLLDQLVAAALAGNPDLDAAAARVRQARAALRERKAAGMPALNTSALFARARLRDQGSGVNDLTLYNVGFDSSWELDLFGGQKRALEAARADVETREANLADARVTLSAEVAQAYVDLRERQQRLSAGARTIHLLEQDIALQRQRFRRGTISRGEVLAAEQARDEAHARLAPLRAEAEALKDTLATLTGAAPGTLDAQLDAAVPVPLPPRAVTVGDPAELLRRRPDVRAAERTLAARSARIGIAEAARFPRLSFLGLIGLGGPSPADVFDLGNVTLAAAPRLSWTFLDFGRARARVSSAEAQRDEAAAQYRAAVLGALRDAEGSLSRFQHQRESLAAFARAEQQATEAAGLVRQRRNAGTVAESEYLAAQRAVLAAQQARIEATAGLTQAFIAVQKALGLGWDGLAPAPASTPAGIAPQTTGETHD